MNSIWDATAVPGRIDSGDNGAVELGVRFYSEVDGFVLGVRFYKSLLNTGPHFGNIWSTDGRHLASATFAGESASGWQSAALDMPLAIAANTIYIVSYHTLVGHYAYDESYFAASGVDNPPLHALQDSADGGNGVFAYCEVSKFPAARSGANYWVDLVFSTTLGQDTEPPKVRSVSPRNGRTGFATTAAVTAAFSEPMDGDTIDTKTLRLDDSSNRKVPATVTYDAATRTATLRPTDRLRHLTTYTATIRGSTSGVKDAAGNPLTADHTWAFTTATSQFERGPGGPILIVASQSNPFTSYCAEILRTEGFNEFSIVARATVSRAMLKRHDVVILGETSLSTDEVQMFTDWVTAGGNLIAMRPDKQLADLLGLTDQVSTLSDAYLRVETAAAPGAGITGETIQFHGTADLYMLDGASTVATLYADATTATPHPAVTLRSVGSDGGKAAAFAYDLARSIVYTRQGNPAWAEMERDGRPPIRSDDLFYGSAPDDPQPDWVNLNKVAIPQADEQQRLLANLIVLMNLDRKPLPRFWYFPHAKKAVVIMTGDDHGKGGTASRFDRYIADSPTACAVDAWGCVRSSSYIYASTPLTDDQAAVYTAQGFEIGLHVGTCCTNWTPELLSRAYETQLALWHAKYASIPSPSSSRTHCIAWSDYTTQAEIEVEHGIRLDTNYYYWPPDWVQDRPGFFTGSGMPQRFARSDGTIIDVYQAATQMTDESGQSYPSTIDSLLDGALGPLGYYGAFTANMHTDVGASSGSDAIVTSALARNVPIVSGRQMLTWLDGRANSSFDDISWGGRTLRFTVSQGTGAEGLQGMVPSKSAKGSLDTITRDGQSVAYSTEIIKGIEYAFFAATPGTYRATYRRKPSP